ncbi:MAG TPA: hypothetical protein PLL09_01160 [Flavobacterium sp.]|uniref:hypothetical protein n=1 Tax=unclassified Flavobacterium TaxID=196869 RepID=UPI000E8D61DB|nr:MULTISPECIES: hypothetical protein [unclassified Flavobacterium]HBI00704.1 hypothetical protein [Flavobacterium sp.]HRE76409.1 hypothetical protein [Flavobacterium sp.]
MKNKKTIYILLPIVLFIWGMLIYQFFSYSTSESTIPDFEPNLTNKLEKIEQIDTFTIDINYRDPFLGKIYKEQKDKKSNSTVQIKSIEPEGILWPDIKYKGIVSDTKDKTKVFLIVIGGKNCLMRIGQTQNEITLKGGNKNEVKLKYKNFTDTFLINE